MSVGIPGWVILLIAVIVVILVAGCSDAGHAIAPSPGSGVSPSWVTVNTPQNAPTVLRACVQGDGIYVSTDSNSSPFVVPADPACR